MEDVVRAYVAAQDFAGLEDIAEFMGSVDESTTRALIDGLASSEWRVRMRCAQALGKATASAELVAQLADLLDDPESSVRREAAHALARLDLTEEWAEIAQPAVAETLRRTLEADEFYDASKLMPAVAGLGHNIDATRALAAFIREQLSLEQPNRYLGEALRCLGHVVPDDAEERALLREALEQGEVGDAAVEGLIAAARKPSKTADMLIDFVENHGLPGRDLEQLAQLFASAGRQERGLRALLRAILDSPGQSTRRDRIAEGTARRLSALIPTAEKTEPATLAELLEATGIRNPKGIARMLTREAAERQRRLDIFDQHARIEVVAGGHYIVCIPAERPDSAWSFITSDVGVRPAPNVRKRDQAELLNRFRRDYAVGDVNGEGLLRWVKDHLQFNMSWGTERWIWRNGTVGNLPQYSSEWEVVATNVTQDEFIADCCDRMWLAAAEISRGGYLAFRRGARTAEDFEFVREHYATIVRKAERLDHRAAINARTQLAIIAQHTEADTDPMPVLDELLEPFEPNCRIHLLGDLLELIGQLLESLPDDHHAHGAATAQIASVVDTTCGPEADLPDDVVGRWDALDRILTRTSLRVPVVIELAAQTRHPQLLHTFAAIVQNDERELALEWLERAVAATTEPSAHLLVDLESAYLRLGRGDDADDVAERRRLLHPDSEGPEFEMNWAMERVARITNECYRVAQASGSLAGHLELAREGALLQQQVIEYWKPHPMSGTDFPVGRATSQASANYLDACIDNELWSEGVAFFRSATDDMTVLRARFRDFPGPAESFFTCGVYCCLESGGDDAAYAVALAKMMALQGLGQSRPYSHLLYARLALWADEPEWAKTHLAKGRELAGSDEAWAAMDPPVVS